MVNWLLSNIDLVCLILGLVLTTLGTVLSFVSKNKGTGKNLRAMGNIVAHLPSFIRTAEKLGGTGEEKKAYVVEQVLLYFKAEGVNANEEQLLSISQQIDELVKLSKELHSVTIIKNTNPFIGDNNENK